MLAINFRANGVPNYKHADPFEKNLPSSGHRGLLAVPAAGGGTDAAGGGENRAEPAESGPGGRFRGHSVLDGGPVPAWAWAG